MVDLDDIGFGRLPAHGLGDDQDEKHPMRAVLEIPKTLPEYKFWAQFFQPLDQGPTGTCVGHGGKHWMGVGPVIQSKVDEKPTAFDLYDACTKVDEWTENDNGNVNFGTSVRALFKVLQSMGYVGEYVWAQNIEDVRDFVLTQGPVVIGVNWYEGMLDPDPYIRPTGQVLGGHCVTIIGHNRMREGRPYTILNSWGRNWGRNGRAEITEADLDKLLFEQWGEAAAGAEIRRRLSPVEWLRRKFPWP